VDVRHKLETLWPSINKKKPISVVCLWLENESVGKSYYWGSWK